MTDVRLTINRAPVLTLWAAMAAADSFAVRQLDDTPSKARPLAAKP
jgi:hypothetical protein